MPAPSTGYRFHRPVYCEDLEAVRGVRVQRVVEQHIHCKYEIGVIEDGGASYDVRGTPIHATGGTLLIVNAGDAHAVTSDEGGCTFALLYVTRERMQRAAQDAGVGDVTPVFEPRALQDPAMSGLLLQLHETLESDADPEHVEALLHGTLCMLVARAAAVVRPDQTQHEAVARVKRHIDEHYARAITIDEMARLAGLSKYHLIRVFRAAHGMPPHAYQNAVRIARAREALATGRSAADVAMETGFADQSHFTRRFKRLVGVAPGEYARWSAAGHRRLARSAKRKPS